MKYHEFGAWIVSGIENRDNNFIMDGLIVYENKNGATRMYAEWLGKNLDLPVINPGDLLIPPSKISYILIGTSISFERLIIRNWLKKNLDKVLNKKLFFFIVAATALSEPASRERIMRKNIPGQLRNNCELFFLPGGDGGKKAGFFSRLIFMITGKMLKESEQKHTVQSGLAEAKMTDLLPLLESVKDFREQPPPQPVTKTNSNHFTT